MSPQLDHAMKLTTEADRRLGDVAALLLVTHPKIAFELRCIREIAHAAHAAIEAHAEAIRPPTSREVARGRPTLRVVR